MADILKPELLWIEGRCYRVNDSTTELTAFQEHDLYETEITYDDADNEGEENDFEITMIDSTRFMTSFHVSKHYVGSIIGKKGATKSRIERDTKTEIKIPKQGQTGDITIYGPSASNVSKARRRINIIVISSRMKQRATHFISVPINHSNIRDSYGKFKELVLSDPEHLNRNLDESLFIRPEKLHLTLGVMCLMDNEERLHASKLLMEAKEKVIMPLIQGHMPVKIRMKGLSYMNDDPREIDVLYAVVQEEGAPSGLLQKLADSLVDHFYKAGFMDKDFGRENLKLHVTLINSKYRRGSNVNDENGSRSMRKRETFDGSGILRDFAEFDFGVAEMSEIHLSQRHCMGPDGYYQPTCVISCKSH